MRSIQTSVTFPLSSVKPFDGLLRYREYCLEAARKALQGATRRRDRSPVTGARMEPSGEVGGIAYARCPETGGLFLAEMPQPAAWSALLQDVGKHRFAPDGFYSGLAQSRTDNVYAPKLEWIQDTLRLQGLKQPSILEAATPHSTFTQLLDDSGRFSRVITVDEMALTDGETVQAAVLLESLDRVDDPAALAKAVAGRLAAGGLLFVTALVSSGFDIAVLGLNNLYVYPPDRANCFSLSGLSRLLTDAGFSLVEVSTPGVLDVEIVRAHLRHDPTIRLSAFEQQLIDADSQTLERLQAFLQQQRLSSFARIVAKKTA